MWAQSISSHSTTPPTQEILSLLSLSQMKLQSPFKNLRWVVFSTNFLGKIPIPQSWLLLEVKERNVLHHMLLLWLLVLNLLKPLRIRRKRRNFPNNKSLTAHLMAITEILAALEGTLSRLSSMLKKTWSFRISSMSTKKLPESVGTPIFSRPRIPQDHSS